MWNHQGDPSKTEHRPEVIIARCQRLLEQSAGAVQIAPIQVRHPRICEGRRAGHLLLRPDRQRPGTDQEEAGQQRQD